MDTVKVKQVMQPCRAGARMLCMPSTIQLVTRRCCFPSTNQRKRGRLEVKANLVVFEAQASSQPTILLVISAEACGVLPPKNVSFKQCTLELGDKGGARVNVECVCRILYLKKHWAL